MLQRCVETTLETSGKKDPLTDSNPLRFGSDFSWVGPEVTDLVTYRAVESSFSTVQLQMLGLTVEIFTEGVGGVKGGFCTVGGVVVLKYCFFNCHVVCSIFLDNEDLFIFVRMVDRIPICDHKRSWLVLKDEQLVNLLLI